MIWNTYKVEKICLQHLVNLLHALLGTWPLEFLAEQSTQVLPDPIHVLNRLDVIDYVTKINRIYILVTFLNSWKSQLYFVSSISTIYIPQSIDTAVSIFFRICRSRYKFSHELNTKESYTTEIYCFPIKGLLIFKYWYWYLKCIYVLIFKCNIAVDRIFIWSVNFINMHH